jgi:acyl-CoA thioesterase I
MKISIIADSIALPRVEYNDIVYYDETWPCKLHYELRHELSEKVYINNSSIRKRTSSSLKNNIFYESITCTNPDFVIIQLGIVDCAPRIISLKERHIFNKRYFPKILREYLIRYRKKNRKKITLKDPLKKAYVKPEDFVSNINFFSDSIYNYNPKIKIIILPIISNYSIVNDYSPGFKSNIILYNNNLSNIKKKNIIEHDFSTLISLFKDLDNLYCSDGYHLLSDGHSIISNYLTSLIKK